MESSGVVSKFVPLMICAPPLRPGPEMIQNRLHFYKILQLLCFTLTERRPNQTGIFTLVSFFGLLPGC